MQPANHGLKRELKLTDLILMQILLVVNFNLAGLAAKSGAAHVALWLFAITLFYVPLARVVMTLSRWMPAEGGVYHWVREGFSPFAGYMAGWSFTIYIVIFWASVGSMLANSFAYAGGAPWAWMADSKPFTIALGSMACLLAYYVNVRGLHVGKWFSGIGSMTLVVTFLMLIYLLVEAWFTRRPSAAGAFAVAWPGFSIQALNGCTKMALVALSGFEVSAISSEECWNAGKDVSRSIFIATPAIALMYILGTAAILAWVAAPKVDLAAPVAQLTQVAFGATTLGRALTVVGVGIGIVAILAIFITYVGMISRLPMVAGWDGLLPAWWSALHPSYRTPSKAIGAVTASLFALGFLSVWGAGNQEAVQVCLAAGFGTYCTMYILLFSVVMFGFRSSPRRPGIGLRLGAFAALSVTVAAFFFELVPLGEVANPAVFAVKVAVTICAANALGVFLYWRGTRNLKTVAVVSGA